MAGHLVGSVLTDYRSLTHNRSLFLLTSHPSPLAETTCHALPTKYLSHGGAARSSLIILQTSKAEQPCMHADIHT